MNKVRLVSKFKIATAVGIGALVLIGVRQVLGFTSTGYSWGDGAILEMYTIHASRGLWLLGPYSQFGWHHPGPLLFYTLLPWYTLAGGNAFGLNAGAVVINVAALVCIAWASVRWGNSVTGSAVLAAMAVYLARVGEIGYSYWNPHVTVLPLGALMLLCAGVSAGHAAALPAVVLLGSFLMQTNVSLVPTVAALSALSLIGLLISRTCTTDQAPSTQQVLRWLAVSLLVLALAWGPPLMEEAWNQPGNLTKLLQFFTESYDRQSWHMASQTWGDSVSAVLTGSLRVPTGATINLSDRIWTVALAISQLPLLLAAGYGFSRRGDRFHMSLCGAGCVTSLAALFSVTRIRGDVREYMVFWISIAGALNWAVLAASLVARLRPAAHPPCLRHRLSQVLMVLLLAGLVVAQVRQLWQYSHRPLEPRARSVGVLSDAVHAYLQRAGLKRPLIRTSPIAWPEAAGVVVRLYKLEIPVSVEREQVGLFGYPLSPRGEEDSVFQVVDTHSVPSDRSEYVLIASDGAIDIYAGPPTTIGVLH